MKSIINDRTEYGFLQLKSFWRSCFSESLVSTNKVTLCHNVETGGRENQKAFIITCTPQ